MKSTLTVIMSATFSRFTTVNVIKSIKVAFDTFASHVFRVRYGSCCDISIVRFTLSRSRADFRDPD